MSKRCVLALHRSCYRSRYISHTSRCLKHRNIASSTVLHGAKRRRRFVSATPTRWSDATPQRSHDLVCIRMSLSYRRVSLALAWSGKISSGEGLRWWSCHTHMHLPCAGTWSALVSRKRREAPPHSSSPQILRRPLCGLSTQCRSGPGYAYGASRQKKNPQRFSR